MRFYLLCIILALSCSAFSLDRGAFTFTRYNLEVRLEAAQQRLGVRGTLRLRNDSNTPQKNAVLQISSSLSWRSIQVDNKSVQFVTQPYESDIDHTGELSEAIVTLPKALEPKGEVELQIGYEGVVPQDVTRLTRVGAPKEAAAHSDWDQISPEFTAVRGVGYVAWYPIATEAVSLSEANSVLQGIAEWKSREASALFDVRAIVMPPNSEAGSVLLINAPGCSAVEANAEAGQTVTSHCRFDHLGLVVPTFVVAGYKDQSGPDRVFYLDGHKESAEVFSRAAVPASKFVREWFGSPQASMIAELPDVNAAPFESGSLLLVPMDNVDEKIAELMLVGQLTTMAKQSTRAWVEQGLAHFAQALYRETQDGRRAALEYLGAGLPALVEEESSVTDKESPNSTSKDAASAAGQDIGHALIANSEAVPQRTKAAYVWWMLRDMVGDTALKTMLAQYQRESDASPSYVEQLIDGAARRDLGWFFDDWVYHDRGLPDFKVVSVYPTKTSQGYLVTITIENSGQAGAEMPVKLRVQGGGEATKRVEVRARSSGVVRFESPDAPDEVIVNDRSVPERDTSNNSLKVTNAARK